MSTVPDLTQTEWCGGQMKQVSPPDTSPLTMECQKCDHREYAEIQPSPGWTPAEQTVYRLLVHRTKGPAKAQEVRALRELSPELRSLPMHVAAERISSNLIVDLGMHSAEDAEALLKKARALGLDASLVGPDDYTEEQQQDGRFFEPFGASVSVGEPREENTVIPFGWILIGVLLIAVIVWLLW